MRFESGRWRTAARMVRAGYNVLMLDTDVVLLEDPYRFWKKPPFEKLTLMAQASWLDGGCGPISECAPLSKPLGFDLFRPSVPT